MKMMILKNKRLVIGIISWIAMLTVLSGCKNSIVPKKKNEKVQGKITVITQRVDIGDSEFKKKYLPEFNKKYPKVKVEFEGVSDYDTAMKIRLNAKDYGDVLLIPNIGKEQLPAFFQSLGNQVDVGKKYRFLYDASYNGKCYGIPAVANIRGILINKNVWEDAGVTTYPISTDEFLNDLRKIKKKGKATPLYTNFASKSLLTEWKKNCIAITGERNWKNEMIEENTPFSKGKPFYEVYNILYEAVRQKLVEKDMTSTDWEKSKQLIADGKIGSMVVGSSLMRQVKALTEDVESITYMPFPAAPGGKQYTEITGDNYIAINKNSKNKKAAKAWLYWFVNDSKYSEQNYSISTVKGKKLPKFFQVFKDADVEFLEQMPAPVGKETLWDDIEKKSGIGLNTGEAETKIINAALTGKASFSTIMNNFNARWKATRESIK
ncbi:ABC transporter substrate-binding protein [Clostridium oryzae]|nr:ABC transporter substrate-binding protein [Clostridium oryzae]